MAAPAIQWTTILQSRRQSLLQNTPLITGDFDKTLRNRIYSTYHPGRKMVSQAYSGEVTYLEPPKTKESKEELIGSLKLKLFSAVSGLNRGLVASEDDLRKAEAAARDLESAGGLVDLSDDSEKLQGRWKLIYSSAFSSRTLGGNRPGPPTGRLLPITLVFQRIDVLSKDFDNIVELELGAQWPLPPVEVMATLTHKFELIDGSKIKIIFEKTTVKTAGNLSQLPSFDLPRLLDWLRRRLLLIQELGNLKLHISTQTLGSLEETEESSGFSLVRRREIT